MYLVLILFLLTSSVIHPVKDKTYRNLRVLNQLDTQRLFVFGNASFGGDLFVKGQIISQGGISGGSVSTESPVTVNAVPRFANTAGTLLKNSLVLVDDSGNITINGITKAGNTVSWPSTIGAAGTFLESDGAGNLVYGTPAGSGNVSTALPFVFNNSIITTDTPSGAENIKESGVTLDGSNNISGVNTLNANVVNAPTLNGNATSATTAGSTTNFSGSLAGDVTGTQSATHVALVGGQTDTAVAAAAVAVSNATSTNTPNTLVERDGSGNFAAGTITANLTGNVTGNLSGNATTATTAGSATNFTGSLTGDVTGTQSATHVSLVGGQTAANVAAATLLANNSTSNNTAGAIVRRDGSGNFSATTITANLNGNATTATTAGSTTSFTGSLAGDVTGTQSATHVALIGGQTDTAVAAAAVAVSNATPTDSPNTLVERDGSGNFAANTITADTGFTGNLTGNVFGNATTATTAGSATNFTGSLSGDVTGTQSATVVSTVGGQTAAAVASATIAANAATSNNTAGTIVKRDSSGDFSARLITSDLMGTVTGTLWGNASSATTAIFATTAGSATNFTGSLSGDVTGTQSATVVSFVGGKTATQVASATTLVQTATSSNTPNTLVLRDSIGDFATHMITIDGTTTNPTDVATKSYVDTVAGLGLQPKTPALVTSTSDVPISGLQTIDGVSLNNNDRVLLVGENNGVNNGLWLAESGAWLRPTDFANGTLAGEAYVLTTSGIENAGSSWLCSTPTSLIGTNTIVFVQFSLPSQTTGANIGTGPGQIFANKTGVTLNFRTLSEGTHIDIVTNTSDVNIATDATSANTPNTIVSRDGTGTFAGSLTGAASLNVLKAGDTMTGNLTMANQSAVRFGDTGSNFVGLNAPTTVSASYTVNLPATAPIAGQVLQATSPTATTWATGGGTPTSAQTYYVSKSGSDTNDGSLLAPFLTISKAVTTANPLANLANPIVISVGAGIFVENNSGGPLTISNDGISLIGASIADTIVSPSDPTQDLFSVTTPNVEIKNFSLQIFIPGSSTKSAINFNSNISGSPRFTSIAIGQFQTGITINSSGVPVALLSNIQAGGNSTAISITNTQAVIENCLMSGPLNTGSPQNTGIAITGTNSQVAILGNALRQFNNAISVSGGAGVRVLGTDIELTNNSIVNSGASNASIVGCNFLLNNAGSINIAASGAGTETNVVGCHFQCTGTAGTPQGTALQVTTGATMVADSSSIENAVTAIQCGTGGDTSSTIMRADSIVIFNCTNDIQQDGSSTLLFISGVFDSDKTSITDPTNVSFSAFDRTTNDTLAFGSGSDITRELYEIFNGQPQFQNLTYSPNYYGNKGTVYINPNSDSTFTGVQAQTGNAYQFIVTGSRDQEAGIQLLSDTGNFGIGDNTRGWKIAKAGTNADLVFSYTNNDTSGQAARAFNPLVQINGFDNQLEFPTATNSPLPTNTTTKLLWGGDTNLYRSAANTLQTDDDFVVVGPSNINITNQGQLRLQDSTGTGHFVGLDAPITVTSYTVNLPGSAPTSGQVLQATSPTATTWATIGGSPTVAKTYYVSLSGNDSNDGSLLTPFRTVSHAVSVANTVANPLTNPIVISVGAGIFVENNSGGPITITAGGISIVGESVTGTIIQPSTSSVDLFSITNANVEFFNLTLEILTGSTANGITVTAGAGQRGAFHTIRIIGFQTGIAMSAGNVTPIPIILLEEVISAGNATAISVNNLQVVIQNGLFLGPLVGTTPTNTAISITGTNAIIMIMNNSFRTLNTGVSITGGAQGRVSGSNFGQVNTGISNSGNSFCTVLGTNFLLNPVNSINIATSGAGTETDIVGCQFRCTDTGGNPQGTALQVTSQGTIVAASSVIEGAVTGIQCGTGGDTSSTVIRADNVVLLNCTNDIQQIGSSFMHFIGGVFDSNKLSIADPTNVNFGAFDRTNNDTLAFGSGSDLSQEIYEMFNGQAAFQTLIYKPNYYGSKGTVYQNPNNNPTFTGVQSNLNNAFLDAVTGNRTNQAAINLLSDTSGSFGSGADTRGWVISKLGNSTADLAFTFTNNDTSGLAARGLTTVMQLDGFDNIVEFPLATNSPLPTNTVAKLVWAGDTNLYRAAVGLLQTDGNFVVGGTLTSGGTLTVQSGGANITGNLLVTGTSQLTGAVNMGNNLTVNGTVTTGGALTVQSGGANITGASSITGNLTETGSIVPSIDNTFNLGAPLLRWANIYAVNFTTTGVNASQGTFSNLLVTGTSQLIGNVLMNNNLTVNGNITDAGQGTFGNLLVTGTSRLIGTLTAGTILPATDNSFNLGSSAQRWANIFALNLTGTSLTINGAGRFNTLLVTGTSEFDGTVTLSAGTPAIPSLQFLGSTSTGLSAPTTNSLSLTTTGLARLIIDSSGNTTYKSNYKLYAYRSTTQGINTTTATIIFDTELLDPNANYNTATGVYTVPFTGVYMINVTVNTQTAAQPATETVNIVRNGTAVTGASVSQVLSNNTARQPMTTCVLLSLTAGDLIRVDYTTNKSDTIQPNDTHIAIHYMSF